MKLYDVPNKTRVRLLSDIQVPIGALELKAGDEIFFDHLDGMYSLCKDKEGNTVHLIGWAEVEIINDKVSRD